MKTKITIKLPRHLESKLSDKDKITIWVLKNKSKETKTCWKNLMAKLRNLGTHKQNYKVLKGEKGQLLVINFQKSETADPYNYTPCLTCYGCLTKNQTLETQLPIKSKQEGTF